MKKMISWLAFMAVFTLLLYSCRSEDFSQENDSYKSSLQYKVYTLNKQQVKNDFFLFDKVAGIQSLMSGKPEKGSGSTGKSPQDSLLQGAVIGINKVLVVENNGEKTYTFALKRNYPTSKTENLVLKRNADSTFSGKLIQYDVTLKEKELFNSWHSINLKNRVKVYSIENLNISSSARVGSVSFGCFTVWYEDGSCSGQEHHAYGDSSCPLIGTAQQAPSPRILSITEVPNCSGSGGGDSGGLGGGIEPTQPSGGGGDNGLTIIFDDINLNYYSSDNMTDPDYVFWSKVTQFVQGQPQVVRNFNNEYHFVYYYIHTYFKNNGGLTPANKNFVSQRLLALSNWYFDFFNKATYLNTDQRLSLAIWSEKYLFEHPEITWVQFENQYLTSPCEKIKTKFEDAKFKGKVTTIDKPEVFDYDHEMGFASAYPVNTNITGIQYQPMENSVGTHNVKLPDGNQYFGYIHSHNNESNGGQPIKIFSPYDVITFLTSCVRNADEHGSITDAYCMVITSQGNYILQYSGTGDYNIGPNQIGNWKIWYLAEVQKLQKEDGTFDQADIEKFFAKFLSESVKINGLEAYHIEKGTGKASKLNTNGIKTPCP